MNAEAMIAACKQHTLFPWSANDAVNPWPIERAEGIYMYTPDGDRIIDFNSQLMSVNIGHGDQRVLNAMKEQMDQLCYSFPGTATAVRARLSSKLAEIVPGDINTFFFTLGGAEANENAIRAARLFSGRNKILARYRSYHGSTHLCMSLSGDPRGIPNEPPAPGIVHVMDPIPYHYSFGKTDAEIVEENLRYLDEVIMYEGAHTIAAMIIETVVGTNGIMPPPEGYLVGLRKLLDKHGILLICDEVMAGFGRTGRLFAFEHGPIQPDIITMAKGLTSSYAPLGAVGLRDQIAEHFKANTFWGGLTYNSHALCLAASEAAINVLLEDGLIENAQRMGQVMRSEMDRLQAKHPSVKEGRCIGLFGMMDLRKNSAGEPMAPHNGASEPMNKLAAFFRENKLFTFVRWGSFMCNPPLCINEEQLLEAFTIIDAGLYITDKAYEG